MGVRRDLRWKLAIIVLVIGVSVWFTFPLGQRMNLGLDLQGGMHLVLVKCRKGWLNSVYQAWKYAKSRPTKWL